MYFRILALLILFAIQPVLLGFNSAYSCNAPRFSDEKKINLSEDVLLIVTHASSKYDFSLASKAGVDQTIKTIKEHGIPLVYLQNSSDPAKSHFYHDCHPTHFVKSPGGNFSFSFQANHVISIGGHLELCQMLSLRAIADRFRKQTATDKFQITIVTDATYIKGYHINGRDSYYQKFDRMTNGWRGKRKITLDTLINLTNYQKERTDLLTRVVKSIGVEGFSQVELHYNNHLIDIFNNRGSTGPEKQLVINFVYSKQLQL